MAVQRLLLKYTFEKRLQLGPRLLIGLGVIGERQIELGAVGTLNEVLLGPSRVSDGTMNLVGALRRAMAICGYSDLKEFQRVEVVLDA